MYVGMAFESDKLRQLTIQCGGADLEALQLRIGTADDASIVYMLQRCPNLRTLALRTSQYHTQVTFAAFGALARHCPHLASLDLTDTALFCDITFVAFLASMQAVPLKFLFFRCCKWLTDISLAAIARYCQPLVALDIRETSCTKDSIKDLVLARKLRVATLHCSPIGSEIIKLLRDAGICPPMKIIPGLT